MRKVTESDCGNITDEGSFDSISNKIKNQYKTRRKSEMKFVDSKPAMNQGTFRDEHKIASQIDTARGLLNEEDNHSHGHDHGHVFIEEFDEE